MCLAEQKAGRRVILIAEDQSGLLGMVQLVFKLPLGYDDPEAANGMDVAMMESLRLRPQARRPKSANELVGEVQRLAMKRKVKTLTFLISMHNSRGITQAKSWGFEEFRIMPEADKMLAFFRKIHRLAGFSCAKPVAFGPSAQSAWRLGLKVESAWRGRLVLGVVVVVELAEGEGVAVDAGGGSAVDESRLVARVHRRAADRYVERSKARRFRDRAFASGAVVVD